MMAAVKSTKKDDNQTKSMLSSSSSSSSSDSDGSDSSSDSDSSSAASSVKTKPVKPATDKTQFSVTSSDTASLRMKIAIPRNPSANPTIANNKIKQNTGKMTNGTNKNSEKPKKNEKSAKKPSSSESSCCSSDYSEDDDEDDDDDDDDDESGSDSSSSEKNDSKKEKAKAKRKMLKKKRANRGGSTSSGGGTDTSDSDSSDDAIQEFNPDDLDEILPKDFNESVTSFNNSAASAKATSTPSKPLANASADLQDPDGASSSDMELPALVNAAIQRVESCSDAESTRGIPATSHYTSSLLRDFVVKTTMLGATSGPSSSSNGKDCKPDVDVKNIKTESPMPMPSRSHMNGALNKNASPRKRGRPAKSSLAAATILNAANQNKKAMVSESPDSGILSTHSPTNSPKTESKKSAQKKRPEAEIVVENKLKANRMPKYSIASLDRNTYATERVLYPPRGKKKGPGRPKSAMAGTTSKFKDDNLDPVWKKIDISKKFHEPNLSGYKSDGGYAICCSKELAARSGYVSDYGGGCGRNKMSGYKSDHSSKSRKSYKSCGYRSDCSVRHRKQVRKKRRKKILPSINNNSNNKNYNQNSKYSAASLELDIMQLAGLTLGSTSEDSNSSHDFNTTNREPAKKKEKPSSSAAPTEKKKPSSSSSKKKDNLQENPFQKSASTSIMPVNNFNGIFSALNKYSNKYTFSSPHIGNKNSFATFLKSNRNKDNGKVVKRLPLSKANVLKNTEELSKKFQMKLSESVGNIPKASPTKSVCSKRSRRRSECFDRLETKSNASKGDFPFKAGSIRSRRMSTMSRCSSRSGVSRHHFKKRKRKRTFSKSEQKVNEAKVNADIEKLSDSMTNLCKISLEVKNKEVVKEPAAAKTQGKRGAKKRKASDIVDSPSTSTTGTKRRNKKVPTQSPDDHKLPLKKRHYLLTPGEKNSDSGAEREEAKPNNSATAASTTTVKAVTPKKRHLLKPPELHVEDNVQVKSSDSPLTIDNKVNESTTSTAASKKSDARKKNRLEEIMAKLQPTATGTAILADNNLLAASNRERPSVIQTPAKVGPTPPPGVFEPTIDLELQIPSSTISLPSLITKVELLDSPRLKETITKLESEEANKRGGVVDKLLNRSGGQVLLKRKRKKFNRTGFPSVKKKKKKPIESNDPAEDTKPALVLDPILMGIQTLTKHVPNKQTNQVCDRVPKEGEPTDRFIERNSRPRLSVVSLERLQGKVPLNEPTNITTPQTVDKRNLRAKSEKPETTLDNSVKNKRSRKDAPKIVKKDLEKVKDRETRELSSDNEPLSSLLAKTKNSNKNKENKKSRALTDDKPIKAASMRTRSASIALEPAEIVNKVTKTKMDQIKINKPDHIVLKEAVIKLQPCIIATDSMDSVDGMSLLKRMRSKSICRIKTPEPELVNRSLLRMRSKSVCKIIEQSVVVIAKKTDEKMRKRKEMEISKSSPTKSEVRLSKRAKLVETVTELNAIQAPDSHDEDEHEPLPESEAVCMPEFRTNVPSPTISIDPKDGKAKKPLKKKYLTAGLFSDTFKEDTKSTKGKVAEVLLPPPFYCEKYLRRTRIDFLLPFDLWQAHDTGKLPGRDVVASWNFKKIRANVYYDVKPNPSSDHQPCSCKPNSECLDDCLNRMMYTECSKDTCPCGDKCKNNKIQKHEYAPGLERFMTENKGWGMRTKEAIKKGEFIIEYLGEVVTDKEFKERMRTIYINDTHHYCLQLDGGLVIDGQRMGSDARFVNHSCAPNCEMQKWSVNGLFRMVLFALKEIKPNEELCYDYNFSLFNPSEGQPCKCGAVDCRGVIGGKSQRVKPLPSDKKSDKNEPSSTDSSNSNTRRKRQAKKNHPIIQIKYGPAIPVFHAPTAKERALIKLYHCFLLRNLNKIKKKEKLLTENPPPTSTSPGPSVKNATSQQMSAIRAPRNTRTRGLAHAADDPELEKLAKVAVVLREICHELATMKDGKNKFLVNFLAPPSKKKVPLYYERIPKPIDMVQIQANIEKGTYKQPKAFEEDMMTLLSNAIKYYGISSPEGTASETLKSQYHALKAKSLEKLEQIVGDDCEILKGFAPKKEPETNGKAEPTEDIIRCICGLFKDEGLMIQCSKCLVWQHTECTKADTKADNYMCERCDPREVNYEIPLNEYTDEGYQYYLSLMRGDLQVRQTDTVYVLRDIPMAPDKSNPNAPVKKHTYETIGKVDYNECDIFRIESLWKNGDGKRFAYGHHYLRPHETFHEPSRRFYPNEVVRVPLYEVVPIELIIDRCWVLDPATFCKGRPVDSSEPHVYICELRVDKGARLFTKISRHQYPVCTKNYAFHKFEQKLKISKTFAPHDLGKFDKSVLNRSNRDINKEKKKTDKKKDETNGPSSSNSSVTTFRKSPVIQLLPPPPKTLQEKRTRLETTLGKLMGKMILNPSAVPPVDISYLLTGRGSRRRTNTATPVPANC